jgi:hypothetical protein
VPIFSQRRQASAGVQHQPSYITQVQDGRSQISLRRSSSSDRYSCAASIDRDGKLFIQILQQSLWPNSILPEGPRMWKLFFEQPLATNKSDILLAFACAKYTCDFFSRYYSGISWLKSQKCCRLCRNFTGSLRQLALQWLFSISPSTMPNALPKQSMLSESCKNMN